MNGPTLCRKPPSGSPSAVKTALILIDHGSVRAAANEMLELVADRVRARGEYDIVRAAHMELCDPTLQQTFDACVAEGAERVVVHPYFLSPGRHSQSDIPRMTREAAASHPGVECYMTDPLGVDERIVDLVLARSEQAVGAGPLEKVEAQEAETVAR